MCCTLFYSSSCVVSLLVCGLFLFALCVVRVRDVHCFIRVVVYSRSCWELLFVRVVFVIVCCVLVVFVLRFVIVIGVRCSWSWRELPLFALFSSCSHCELILCVM